MVGNWLRAGLGLAGAGAAAGLAADLAGTRWAVPAAVVGGAVGAFAPSWVDWRRDRNRQRADLALLPGLAPSESLAGLLRPDRKVVEFVGRAGEIGGLLAWCEDDRSSPVRLLVGPGGVGKTRLAAELMERLRARGWSCSLVGPGREAGAVEVAAAAGGRGLLLVVDYAETRADLRSFVESVGRRSREGAGRRDHRRRIRALLIARGAGEWWDRLGAADPGVRDLVSAAEPIELAADVGANLTGSQIAAHAVPFFARALNVAENVAESAAALAIEVPADPSPTPVLVLHAAALTAILRGRDSGAGAPAGSVVAGFGVLGELLGHEQRYWNASLDAAGLGDLDATTCRRAVALMCLVPAVDESDAAELLARVPDLRDADDRLLRRSARWLQQLYAPGSGAWWGSLRPDLLAEYLVLSAIREEPGLAAAYLTGLGRPATRSGLTVLARAAADYAEPVSSSPEPVAVAALRAVLRADMAGSSVLAAIDVAVQTPGVLGAVLAGVLRDAPAPPGTLTRVEAAIPYPSTALADAHLLLARRISETLPANAEPGEIARWQHRLGLLNAQIGQYADAFRYAEQATFSYRQLWQDHPDRYANDLADALTRLGTHLLDLGRPSESVAPIEEAVAIRRELAGADRDRYLGQLAESLNNLSIALFDVGRADEALSATAEAVAIRRQLARADPDRYLGQLALSLNNLGIRLYTLGRVHEAALTAQEAVAIQRRQAEGNPDRHLSVLAQCLNNAGGFIQEDGDPQLALPYLQEAVTIHRQLATEHPGRYLDRLAASLDNLSNILEDLHQSQNAIPHSEEGLAIRRRLAESNPDRYQPDVANSLTNLASRLLNLARPDEALPKLDEAVTIRRRLAGTSPDRYQADLAESLTYLGLALSKTHRGREALSRAEEALTLYRGLTDTGRPSGHPYLAGLARPITALASVLTALGHEAEAAEATAIAQTARQARP